MKKFKGLALFFDISNWVYNLSLLSLIYTISKPMAVIIPCLLVLRHIADTMHRSAIFKEVVKQKEGAMKQINDLISTPDHLKESEPYIVRPPTLTEEEMYALDEMNEFEVLDEDVDPIDTNITKKDLLQ